MLLKHSQSLLLPHKRIRKLKIPPKLMFLNRNPFSYFTGNAYAKWALKILAEGICRARMDKADHELGFLAANCHDVITTSMEMTSELEALWRQLKTLYLEYAKLNEKSPADLIAMLKQHRIWIIIADTIAVHIKNLSFDERQKLLETPDLKNRMFSLCSSSIKK